MTDDHAPLPLPPVLLERLRRELTDPLKARVLAFAKTRVGVLRSARIPTLDDPEQEAEILVQDAVTSTILGHRRWEPDLPLYDHLCGVVRSETGNRAAHARKHRHVSVQARNLDESSDGSAKLHARITQKAPTSLARPGRNVSTGDAARKLCQRLREHALGKPATVRMLIDAYESGCEDRKDILDATEMTADEYRNARRILDRMLAALPDDFHDGALDALEITHDGTEPLRR
jgi:hypothetical protein